MRSLVPTRKWFAAAITGALTVVGHALASGGFDTTEYGELVTLAIALTGAWLVPNDATSAARTLGSERGAINWVVVAAVLVAIAALVFIVANVDINVK